MFTYFQEPENLHHELRALKADLTARFTNNEIKKDTREKINVLINDLLTSSEEELVHIAHSDAYFGLVSTVNAEERTCSTKRSPWVKRALLPRSRRGCGRTNPEGSTTWAFRRLER